MRRARTPWNSLACDLKSLGAWQRSHVVKTQTALGSFGLILCALAMMTPPSAYAGPANRRAQTQSPPNYPINLDGFGAPLPAVANSLSDLSTFATGQLNFKEIEQMPQLGPLFNGTTCTGCHSQPATGGGGLFINEIRVRNNTAPGPVHIFAVDNMLRNGPQSQGATPIFAKGVTAEPLGCQTHGPRMPTLGLPAGGGEEDHVQHRLADLRSDQRDFRQRWRLRCRTRCACPVRRRTGRSGIGSNADPIGAERTSISARHGQDGHRNFLHTAHVGRFGWKDDHAFLRAFSGDAYLNEMGITNPDNPTDTSSCAIGVTQYGMRSKIPASKMRPVPTGAPTSTASPTSCARSRRRLRFRKIGRQPEASCFSRRWDARDAMRRCSQPPRIPHRSSRLRPEALR